MFNKVVKNSKIALVATLFSMPFSTMAEDAQFNIAAPQINAQTYVLMDYNSGAVLASLNPDQLKGKSYQEIAKVVLKLFFDDFSDEEIAYCVENAYDEKFEDSEIAPIKNVGDVDILELFHGKTAAFKDMALSILPYLLTTSMKKENETKNKGRFRCSI